MFSCIFFYKKIIQEGNRKMIESKKDMIRIAAFNSIRAYGIDRAIKTVETIKANNLPEIIKQSTYPELLRYLRLLKIRHCRG